MMIYIYTLYVTKNENYVYIYIYVYVCMHALNYYIIYRVEVIMVLVYPNADKFKSSNSSFPSPGCSPSAPLPTPLHGLMPGPPNACSSQGCKEGYEPDLNAQTLNPNINIIIIIHFSFSLCPLSSACLSFFVPHIPTSLSIKPPISLGYGFISKIGTPKTWFHFPYKAGPPNYSNLVCK
jgi:hypothetical protein